MAYDNNIEFLLAFISAILGLSVPLMLQAIERVDDKYHSTRLAERLKREPVIRAYGWTLAIALLSCTYAMFFEFPSPWDCWLMNHSADLLALLSCVFLIGFFLGTCFIILIYYNPEKLQNKIIGSITKAKNNPSKKETALRDFVDLSKTILESSSREPALHIYDVLESEIGDIIEAADNDGGMIIPKYISYGITSLNENLCQMERRPYSINNGNILMKLLISAPTKMTEDTFSLLWRNLILQLYYNQEDWVYEYWTAAVQAYDLDLHRLFTGLYSTSEVGNYTLQDAEKRLDQRQRFLEFHVVLCAYILHQKRYALLENLFWYTRTFPPEYPLIPSSLSEIIAVFKQLDESPRWGMPVENYYPFLGMKGIVGGEIKGIVKQYLALLFLRLFSPNGLQQDISLLLPDKLGPLKAYDSYLDYIESRIESISGDQQINKIIRFNGTGAHNEISRIRLTIKNKVEQVRVNGSLDEDLKQENKDELKQFISSSFFNYARLLTAESRLNPDVSFWIYGSVSYPYPNEAFMKDSDMNYSGMAETVGGSAFGKFQHYFASVFYQVSNGLQYKINSNSLFEVFERLGINDEYVIVSFDVYWDFYIGKKLPDLIKTEGKGYSYKGIDIINIPSGSFIPLSQSVFIYKKSDSPTVSFLPPSEEQVKKYQLERLEERYELYSSIVQLSANTELLNIVQKDLPEEKLDEKSLFSAFLIAKVGWSKNIPIVGIKLMYDLRDNGTTDDITSIRPFSVIESEIKSKWRRSECLAKFELEKELGFTFTHSSREFDAEAEKDGKKYYLEVKYLNDWRTDAVKNILKRFMRDGTNQEDCYYVAIVSDTPKDAQEKSDIAQAINDVLPSVNLRFYSLYRK